MQVKSTSTVVDIIRLLRNSARALCAPGSAEGLTTVLQAVQGTSKVVTSRVDQLTAGQASTCLLAEGLIEPDEPLLIAPCDASTVFDAQLWSSLASEPGVDGAVWCFRDHPHANRNPQQYGWVDAGADGRVRRVSCKQALHADVHQDLGVIGIFWFRKARTFFDAARQLVAGDRRVNGEFYVDSVMQLLAERGFDLRAFVVSYYVCFGTPDDVRTYQYWSRHFQRDLLHSFAKGRT